MTPGARASSSAASRLIKETTRKGPAWISTWAITLSLVTLVTRPGKWFRADSATGGEATAPARAAEKRARATPSRRRRPPVVRVAGSWPLSTQRRTVTGLTPRSSAACPMVKVGTTSRLAGKCGRTRRSTSLLGGGRPKYVDPAVSGRARGPRGQTVDGFARVADANVARAEDAPVHTEFEPK